MQKYSIIFYEFPSVIHQMAKANSRISDLFSGVFAPDVQ
jgi:hypothetical protein